MESWRYLFDIELQANGMTDEETDSKSRKGEVL